MKFFGIKEARVCKLRANFCCVWTLEGLVEKKQNLAREKTWEKMTILFFLARAPRMSFDHKNLQAPCAPKPLWCQKISYFFEFSYYFFEFTVHMRTKFMISFATSSQGVQTAHKFARALRTWLSSIPQNFRFFWFFLLFFSGWSKSFDRTVTAQKGISISDTNGGGAKLSIPKN